ncbi:MAG: hypothetical protein ACREFI_17540 [Stellaceae bacterium]
MPQSVSLLTLQFLAWVEARPRTYAEARQAWRSTCPTTCAWEDAISENLIEFESSGGGRLTDGSSVVLSARGRAALVAQEAKAFDASDQLDPSVVAGGAGKTLIPSEERRVERFGEGDVDRVISR